MEKLFAASELWESIRTYDYYTREELMVGNAFLTAEAAVGLAIGRKGRRVKWRVLSCGWFWKDREGVMS